MVTSADELQTLAYHQNCIARKYKTVYYCVILRRVRESLLPWKSNKYYVFVRVRARRAWGFACSACVQPCLSSIQRVRAILWRHLWPLRLQHIFRGYLISGAISRGERSYWTSNVCFDFLYSFCLKRFIINVKTSSCEVPVIVIWF
jgi:hypothetical protein